MQVRDRDLCAGWGCSCFNHHHYIINYKTKVKFVQLSVMCKPLILGGTLRSISRKPQNRADMGCN